MLLLTEHKLPGRGDRKARGTCKSSHKSDHTLVILRCGMVVARLNRSVFCAGSISAVCSEVEVNTSPGKTVGAGAREGNELISPTQYSSETMHLIVMKFTVYIGAHLKTIHHWLHLKSYATLAPLSNAPETAVFYWMEI